MVGSFLYNCWAALIAFTIYFLVSLQSTKTPTSIIIDSFIFAIVGFLFTYLVRFIIAFVIYTPTDEQEDEHIESEETTEQSNEEVEEQTSSKDNTSPTVNNDQAEELAKVVKTMMSKDE